MTSSNHRCDDLTDKIRVRTSGNITWKQVASVLACVAAIATAHAYFVVPRVIAEARTEWRKDDEHLATSMRMERNPIIDALNSRLGAIEARGIRVEDKLDRLIESRK